MNTYYHDTTFRLGCTFKKLVGGVMTPTDPDSVKLEVRLADSDTWTALSPVTKDATGVYHYDMTPVAALGPVTFKWTGTGTVYAWAEQQILIK